MICLSINLSTLSRRCSGCISITPTHGCRVWLRIEHPRRIRNVCVLCMWHRCVCLPSSASIRCRISKVIDQYGRISKIRTLYSVIRCINAYCRCDKGILLWWCAFLSTILCEKNDSAKYFLGPQLRMRSTIYRLDERIGEMGVFLTELQISTRYHVSWRLKTLLKASQRLFQISSHNYFEDLLLEHEKGPSTTEILPLLSRDIK